MNKIVCGLSSEQPAAFDHLVEAATALAKLTGSAAKQSEGSPTSIDADEVDKKPRSKRDIFPQRLMAILNDSSLTDIVSWLPHGRSFVIIRPDVFTDKVLPKYLPPVDARSSTKYPSFTRKLNRWGFRQATRGPDTGAFHHPLFRRDKPELCLDMVCQRSRDRKPSAKKSPTLKEIKVASVQTGDSLEDSLKAINTAEDQSPAAAATVVSVDDSRSDTSVAESSTFSTPCIAKIPKGITNDKGMVESSLHQRDVMEHLRVARAMLYESYMKALKETNDHAHV